MKARNGFLLVAVLMLAYWAAFNGFIGIKYKTDILTVGSNLIASLFVVAVFVERSTAVLNSIWFGAALREAETQERLARIAWSHANFGAEFLDKMKPAAQTLATVEAKRDKAQAWAALFIALGVSAAGLRTLEVLQDVVPASLPVFQLVFYHLIDIVLTAGLIAGGSAGIAAITDLLRKYIDATKAKLPA
ncbi:hypothetical protein [Paucibacter sp. B2R-40]|uniref:hypothetical protein n=1 Tax=Paucibacter sp. B2R-40 TaxID=2893554 RepID=UPI0021E4993C|nr:hypothetical protein [Paucibacter sp. B2R-40]